MIFATSALSAWLIFSLILMFKQKKRIKFLRLKATNSILANIKIGEGVIRKDAEIKSLNSKIYVLESNHTEYESLHEDLAKENENLKAQIVSCEEAIEQKNRAIEEYKKGEEILGTAIKRFQFELTGIEDVFKEKIDFVENEAEQAKQFMDSGYTVDETMDFHYPRKEV